MADPLVSWLSIQCFLHDVILPSEKLQYAQGKVGAPENERIRFGSVNTAIFPPQGGPSMRCAQGHLWALFKKLLILFFLKNSYSFFKVWGKCHLSSEAVHCLNNPSKQDQPRYFCLHSAQCVGFIRVNKPLAPWVLKFLEGRHHFHQVPGCSPSA